MATQKNYTTYFKNTDLSADDVLTLNYAAGTTISKPLYAVINYGVSGISTAPIGLKKLSDTSCEVNVSECPKGSHIIHIFYEL